MPSRALGATRVYSFTPAAGERLPAPGDLFVTTGGTGYLVAWVAAGTRTPSRPGSIRVTVVVVDPEDKHLAPLETREWYWLGEDD